MKGRMDAMTLDSMRRMARISGVGSLMGPLLVATSLLMSGCGGPAKLSGNVSGATGPADVAAKAKEATTDDSTKELTGTQTLTKDVSDSGASIQVKSVELLRNSITSCVGDNLTNVTEDMFLYPNGYPPRCDAIDVAAGKITPEDLAKVEACKSGFKQSLSMNGRVGFLAVGTIPLGANIVDVVSADLYDPRHSSRAGTGADGLTDSYLRAITTIANVVAHNCDVEGACDCSSTKKAEDIVRKCFPGFSPGTTQTKIAVTELAQSCSGSALLQRRKAIASMLSSYAFASAR